MQKYAWSAKFENIEVDADKVQHTVWREVVCISAEHGLEAIRITNEPINSDFYSKIFTDCDDIAPDFVTVGDGHSIHDSRATTAEMVKWNTTFIKLPAASPHLNFAVETFFGL